MRLRTIAVFAIAAVTIAPASAQRGAGGDNQPGRKWSEAELKRFANGVRAGRKLTPASWPNGARVAVCLTFSLNNTSNRLARGDSAVVALTGGEFGATTGLPRVLDVLDRHNVPATFFVPATAALVDPA